MERDPAAYLSGTYDLGFVVHAPELFAGSKLMDLATPDEGLRRYSLEQTQAVIDITRGLKKFFPKTKRPPIVANIGGFTMDEPLSPERKAECYRIFAASLAELDLDGVELIPQTMAPFPWHFGGQRHQNIFIFPEESAAFCAKHDLRMCVDISHTKLAANHFGFDFAEGLAQLGPHTAHLHFGDAKGLDGEGLQIGEGEIDFDEIGAVLRKHAPERLVHPRDLAGPQEHGRRLLDRARTPRGPHMTQGDARTNAGRDRGARRLQGNSAQEPDRSVRQAADRLDRHAGGRRARRRCRRGLFRQRPDPGRRGSRRRGRRPASRMTSPATSPRRNRRGCTRWSSSMASLARSDGSSRCRRHRRSANPATSNRRLRPSSGKNSTACSRSARSRIISTGASAPDGPEPINYDFRNRRMRQQIEKRYLENGSFYVLIPSLLREQNNRLGGKIGMHLMERHKMFQIDRPEDIKLCAAIMRSYGYA